MITQEQLLVSVEVQTKNAAASLDKLNDQFDELKEQLKSTDKGVKNTEKQLGGFGAATVKMNQALELANKGMRLLIGPIKSTVEEFLKAEAATQRLARSVKLFSTGEVQPTIDRFHDLGDSLEALTGVQGEAVEGVAALGKALGITDDRLEKMIRTAADLSAFTGDELNESFKQLIQTLRGNGRALGELSGLLNGLSEAQLRAGKGIDVLGERFKGFAQKAATEIPGLLKRLGAQIGQIMEGVGRVLVEGLDVKGEGSALLALLHEVHQTLEDMSPALIAVVQNVKAVVVGLARAFGGIDFKKLLDELPQLIAAVTALSVVLGVLGAAFNADAVILYAGATWKVVAAQLAAAKATLLVAGKIAVAAVAIGTLVAGMEILLRNVDKGKALVVTFVTALVTGLGVVGETIARITGADSLADWMAEQIDKVVELGAGAADELDFGFSGEAFVQAQKFIGNLGSGFEDLEKQAKAITDASKEMGEGAGKGMMQMTGSVEEAARALEALKDKVDELNRTAAETGASEGEAIRLKAAAQVAELVKLGDKLRLTGQIAAAEKLMREGATAIGKGAANALDAMRLKNLDEIRKETLDLAAAVAAFDSTQLETIEAQRRAALAMLDVKRLELIKDKEVNAEALAALDAQAALIDARAAAQSSRAPGQEFEAAAQTGEGIARKISGAFQSGAIGAAAGMASGIGSIVDSVQAIVDFVPQMLAKVTDLINSVTDLPNKLAEGVQKLFAAALKFVQDFIPNIIKMIGSLLETVVSFVETLPDVLVKMLDSLPDMIMGLLDRLPELASRFIAALIGAMPKLLVQSINFLVKSAPQIAMALMKTFYLELPKAMIKAVIEAFKSLGGVLSSLFKGKFPKLAVDDKALGKAVKAAAKTLTGESEKLFSVMDLTDESGAAAEKADKLGETIKKSTDDAIKQLQKFWDGLVAAWRALWDWVNDKIIQPLINGLREAWLFVYERIVQPLINGLREVWLFVYKTVVEPLMNGIRAVWSWVYDTLLKPWVGMLQTAWSGIMGFLNGWLDALKAVWNGIIGLVSNLWTALKSVWDTVLGVFQGKISLLEGIGKIWEAAFKFGADTFTTIANTFRGIFDGFTSGLSKVGSSLSGIFTQAVNSLAGVGTSIWNGLKNALVNGLGSTISSALNVINPGNLAAKMFQFDYQGKGTVESALGIDVPFARFAQGGMVPGTAPVAGNSFINDRVLALMSPGEAVIPRDKMMNAEVRKLVNAIIDGTYKPPRFAWGVKVGGGGVSVETPLGKIDSNDILGALDPSQLWKQVEKMVWGNIEKMFQHGFVGGGLVGADSQFARFSPGEFVMNRNAVDSYGVDTMRAMNSGGGSAAPAGPVSQTFYITIQTTQPIDDGLVRTKVVPAVLSEFKRLSLDGQTVVYEAGVRRNK